MKHFLESSADLVDSYSHLFGWWSWSPHNVWFAVWLFAMTWFVLKKIRSAKLSPRPTALVVAVIAGFTNPLIGTMLAAAMVAIQFRRITTKWRAIYAAAFLVGVLSFAAAVYGVYVGLWFGYPALVVSVFAVLVWARTKSWMYDGRDPQRGFTLQQKDEICARDGRFCQYCGRPETQTERLHCDHVVPWSQGGKTEVDNGQMLCATCNKMKSAKSDREARSDFKNMFGYVAGSRSPQIRR